MGVKEKDRGLGVVKKGDSAKSVSDKNRKKNPVKNTSDESAEKQIKKGSDVENNESAKNSDKSRKEAIKLKKAPSVSGEDHLRIISDGNCGEGNGEDVNTPEEMDPLTTEHIAASQKSTDILNIKSNGNKSKPVEVTNEKSSGSDKEKSTVDNVTGLDETYNEKLIEESNTKLDSLQSNLSTPAVEEAAVDEISVDTPNISEEESLHEKFGFACSSCERTFLHPNQLNEHNKNCTDTRLDEGILKGINNDSHGTDDDDLLSTDDESEKYPEEITADPLETQTISPPCSTKPSQPLSIRKSGAVRSSARITSPTITSDDEPMDEYAGVTDNPYSGRVTTLRKALGGESDTEDDEEDDTVILRKGVDSLDVCPRCSVQLETSGGNVSFDVSDFSMILMCMNRECRARVKIMNAMGPQQKMMLTCGL